jgi:hypothetical protein
MVRGELGSLGRILEWRDKLASMKQLTNSICNSARRRVQVLLPVRRRSSFRDVLVPLSQIAHETLMAS